MKEVTDPYTVEDLAEYLDPKPEDEEGGGLTTEGEGRPRSRKLSQITGGTAGAGEEEEEEEEEEIDTTNAEAVLGKEMKRLRKMMEKKMKKQDERFKRKIYSEKRKA